MKILGIQGSPRIGGNTDILLDKALSGASSKGADVEKIILNKLKFSPCLECDNAKNDGTCIVKDEMQIIYKKIKEIDGLIIASPIFFGSVTAQAKMMVDRFQCPWKAKYLYHTDIFKKKKIGGFICVSAGSKNDFFYNAKSIVKNLFVTINVSYQEELFCKGIEEKGDVINHPDFLQKAFDLGVKIGGGV